MAFGDEEVSQVFCEVCQTYIEIDPRTEEINGSCVELSCPYDVYCEDSVQELDFNDAERDADYEYDNSELVEDTDVGC